MTVTNLKGEEFTLTKDEEEFFKAVKKMEKLRKKQGRLMLFGSGTLSVRFDGFSAYREIWHCSVICEGGDGGDNFD